MEKDRIEEMSDELTEIVPEKPEAATLEVKPEPPVEMIGPAGRVKVPVREVPSKESQGWTRAKN